MLPDVSRSGDNMTIFARFLDSIVLCRLRSGRVKCLVLGVVLALNGCAVGVGMDSNGMHVGGGVGVTL